MFGTENYLKSTLEVSGPWQSPYGLSLFRGNRKALLELHSLCEAPGDNLPFVETFLYQRHLKTLPGTFLRGLISSGSSAALFQRGGGGGLDNLDSCLNDSEPL